MCPTTTGDDATMMEEHNSYDVRYVVGSERPLRLRTCDPAPERFDDPRIETLTAVTVVSGHGGRPIPSRIP